MKNIDADYYGYRDEDDGIIVPLELEAQKEAIKKALEEEKEAGIEQVNDEIDDHLDDYQLSKEDDDDDYSIVNKKFTSHIPSFSLFQQIEEAMLERKKAQLLAEYANVETLSSAKDNIIEEEEDEDEKN